MEAVKISNLSYKYPSADEYCLKNVSFSVSEGEVCAIVGPNGCGKTTLTEALLYMSGASERMGRVEDGTTASDFDPEEIRRKASPHSSVVPVEYEGIKYNLIDAPGLFDFETGAAEGIMAAESVLICVSGRSGVTVGAEKAYQLALKNNKARMIFVTKADLENADYFKILEQMKIKFGPSVCPCVVPVRLDDGTVLRVSVSTATVGALLLGVTQPMLAVLAAALIGKGAELLNSNDRIPQVFKGAPAMLLYVGLLSLAFAGFTDSTLFT